ncbi:hypothetical protein COBT_001691 [Conglomerata obtusa]
MSEKQLFKSLIYCYKCYKPSTTATHFYIGECMHITCKSCFTDINRCIVCQSKNAFKLLDDVFIQKLLQNPTQAFIEPIESSMFQISSAMNLIEKQKGEIAKLHRLLRRAKDEMTRLKNVKIPDGPVKGKLFNFHKEESTDAVKNTIDKIYQKSKQMPKKYDALRSMNDTEIKNNTFCDDSIFVNRTNNKSEIKNKNKYLLDLTNKKKKLFTDYNPGEMSISSSKSSRLTIPNKNTDFKYVYRKQSGF